MQPERRPISQDEIDVIATTIRRASVVELDAHVLDGIGSLTVTGPCSCGCASVGFGNREAETSRPIADGMGHTVTGGDIGIILWGTSTAITGLEIYDLGAGNHDLTLPIVETTTISDFAVSTDQQPVKTTERRWN